MLGMSLLCSRYLTFSCTPPQGLPVVYLQASGKRAGESELNFLKAPLCIYYI